MSRRSLYRVSDGRERGALLSEAVALAWRAFDHVADRTCRVTPSVPILFFGDLDTYRASPLRVLTVGLNPSRKEFPDAQPFQCFPLAEGNREPSRYLDAMSAYFHTDPYRGWFSAFEPLLNGMGRFGQFSSAAPLLYPLIDELDHRFTLTVAIIEFEIPGAPLCGAVDDALHYAVAQWLGIGSGLLPWCSAVPKH